MSIPPKVVASMSRTRAVRGSVTAETAVVLPVLVLMLVFGLWVASAAVATLRCGDTAREGARALARGESATTVRAAVLADAPEGARMEVTRSGRLLRVRVSAVVQPWAGLGLVLPALPVAATVSMAEEP